MAPPFLLLLPSPSSSSSPFFHPCSISLPPPIRLPSPPFRFSLVTCSLDSSNSPFYPPLLPPSSHHGLRPQLQPSSSGSSSRNSGSYSSRSTVSVFWDLDNKPPKVAPYNAALHLRHVAAQFGDVVDMVAYANRHAFLHVPGWVREERQERRHQDLLERTGIVKPAHPYVCGMCGRKCNTNLDLKRHFKQLHERERQKRMSRLNSLKGKKRAKFKQTIYSKDQRYKEAARPLFVPKVGYGLESELRRAGVYVRTVEYKPQAADRALKKQIVNSMNKGVQCICLVSDDSDFSQMLKTARAKKLRTVVFGDTSSLRQFADVWLPWDEVAQGLPGGKFDEAIREWSFEDDLVQELRSEAIVGATSGFPPFRGPHSRNLANSEEYAGQEEHSAFVMNPRSMHTVSAFSEEEGDSDELSEDEDEDEWFLDDDDDDEDEEEEEWEFEGD